MSGAAAAAASTSTTENNNNNNDKNKNSNNDKIVVDEKLQLALSLSKNKNANNDFNESKQALINDSYTTVRSYSVSVNSDKSKFFETVANNTSNKLITDYCTKMVAVSAFKTNRLFYKDFARQNNKNDTNLILFNQMMTIYVTKCRQKKTRKNFNHCRGRPN